MVRTNIGFQILRQHLSIFKSCHVGNFITIITGWFEQNLLVFKQYKVLNNFEESCACPNSGPTYPTCSAVIFSVIIISRFVRGVVFTVGIRNIVSVLF